MELAGKTVGLLGTLPSLSRRRAAREIAARRGVLRHGVTRKTQMVVFGPTLLDRWTANEIAECVADLVASGRAVLGEAQLLAMLRNATPAAPLALDARTLCSRSGLSEGEARLLALFGGFDGDGAMFSFADAILARKYAGLIAGGADWLAIARSLQGVGPAASLTAFALRRGPAGAILAERGDVLSALDGQTLLPLEDTGDDPDMLFTLAEDAEADGDLAEAAALYHQCLSLDPGDSIAAFNRGNCLLGLGDAAGAREMFIRAIQRDPTLVEAWFNLATLLRDAGEIEAARFHLGRALAIDPDYGDATYNLAALEFSAGRYDEARAAWQRYIEIDSHSEWAQAAQRGIRYVDLLALRKAAAR